MNTKGHSSVEISGGLDLSSNRKKDYDVRPVSMTSVVSAGQRTSTRAIMGAIHSVQISAYMEVQRRHLMRAITTTDFPWHLGTLLELQKGYRCAKLCFTPLIFCRRDSRLPTRTLWSGSHYRLSVSSVEATTSTATTKYPASPSQYLAKVPRKCSEIL